MSGVWENGLLVDYIEIQECSSLILATQAQPELKWVRNSFPIIFGLVKTAKGLKNKMNNKYDLKKGFKMSEGMEQIALGIFIIY